MRDVVAIPHESELEASEIAEVFLQREDVRQRLTGMETVAERVDHGQLGPVRQLINGLLREGARHDAVGPAIEVACDVLQRFTVADGSGSQNGVAAELLDCQFERHTGTQRGLFEQKTEILPLQGLREPRRAFLHLLREFKQCNQLILSEI